MTDALIGKIIGGYEILNVIGRGGMATVYRAQQKSMNRDVAMKVLPEKYINDDTYIQRFNQEVAIVAKLEHRNIVPVHDYGEFNGQPYIVMRYMSGGSVDDMLNNGPLEIEQLVDIIDQIAPALDYAHSKQVLHRDLKPSNVLLDDDGGAYLTDFGIARVLGEPGSKGITTQGVVGTPSYMSPEQAQGLPLDNRSDIYALGVMLFELATGRRPFESDTPYGIAVLQVTTPPPSPRTYNPQLSFAVEEVIYKALRKKREERFPNAVAVAEALKRAINKPVMSLHDTQPGGIPRPQQPVPQRTPPPPQQMMPPPAPLSQPMYASVPSQPMTSGMVGTVRRRRSKPRGSNVWMSAALGGLLGCGLLAILALIALIVFSSANSNSTTTSTPSASGDSQAENNSLPPLDATSEAAREALITESGSSEELPTSVAPGIAPIGVRETPTLNPSLRRTGGVLVYFAERDGNYDLYKLDLLSGDETRLTFDSNADSYPAVSPDGRLIAFQSNRDGDFDIYVMDIDGKNLKQLTDNTVLDRIASWSPNGEWLVFSSDTRNDETYDLYQMRADGSELHPIFSNGARNSHPRYSPDGRYIVFTTGTADDGATWEIGRLDLQTDDFIQLTNNSSKDWSPSYSPDGSTIIYLTGSTGSAPAFGDSAIALLTGDGSTQTVLYDGGGYEWGLAYSPDGTLISYTTLSTETGREEVYVMRSDSSGIQQVTFSGGQGAVWVPG
ncbi:MAG: serine/threonine-protein kinase [Anaerolineae bacterium]|nr:serine/threonine-protein kinase [Anaerolineae bacterium]